MTSEDPELVRVAEALLPGLTERSGLELVAPIRVERRSRGQLESYLRYKLDEEVSPERAERVQAVYATLGLIPPDLDLRSTLLDLYLEQVAGFYDPDSTALFVLDDQPAESLEALLMHELVHAIQDQATNLDSIVDPERGNDRSQAAAAAVEGHASLVMFEYSAGVDLRRVPNFAARFRPAEEALAEQSPRLAAAPRILRELLLFPYFGGASYVEALWKERPDRIAPFGAYLPQSTADILHPERQLSGEGVAVVELSLEAPESWTSVHEDTLGEVELRVFLEEHLEFVDPGTTVGWRGDRYQLMEGETGRRALAWVSVWATIADRDRVQARVTEAAASLEGAVVEGFEFEGRPAFRLLVGDAARPAVRIAGT